MAAWSRIEAVRRATPSVSHRDFESSRKRFLAALGSRTKILTLERTTPLTIYRGSVHAKYHLSLPGAFHIIDEASTKEAVPGCLYCGKDIGPFRLLRDSEFCSAVHRKSYGQRLGAALGRIGAPEPPPAGMAGFRLQMPVQDGNHQYLYGSPTRSPAFQNLRMVKAWPAIAPVAGANALETVAWPRIAPVTETHGDLDWLRGNPLNGHAAALGWPDPILGPGLPECGGATRPLLAPGERTAGPQLVRSRVQWLPADRHGKLPEMRLDVEADAAEGLEQVPALFSAWMTSPAADAAEREVIPAVASWQAFAVRDGRLPEMRLEAAIAAQPVLAFSEEWIAGAAADAAEREVIAAVAASFVQSCSALLPRMRLAIAPTAIEPIADFKLQPLAGMEAPAAIATERTAQAGPARLPEMSLEASDEALAQIPELCEQWMPGPAADAAEREVAPSIFASFLPSASLSLPAMRLPIERSKLPARRPTNPGHPSTRKSILGLPSAHLRNSVGCGTIRRLHRHASRDRPEGGRCFYNVWWVDCRKKRRISFQRPNRSSLAAHALGFGGLLDCEVCAQIRELRHKAHSRSHGFPGGRVRPS